MWTESTAAEATASPEGGNQSTAQSRADGGPEHSHGLTGAPARRRGRLRGSAQKLGGS